MQSCLQQVSAFMCYCIIHFICNSRVEFVPIKFKKIIMVRVVLFDYDVSNIFEVTSQNYVFFLPLTLLL